jgi:cytochrome oxidase Cu insertion factor (SCO1/SenC/PrrC family)
MRHMVLAIALFAACADSTGARGEDPRHLRLVDQRGSVFTLAEMRGQPTFITFVATRCTDACPIAIAAFARLARRIDGAHAHARLLTITLDPDYDTPFVMARLARTLRADPRRWRFASGDRASVYALMHAFGVVTQADAKGVPDVHSTFVYLLDRRARLARMFLLSEGFENEALRSVRLLVAVRPKR